MCAGLLVCEYVSLPLMRLLCAPLFPPFGMWNQVRRGKMGREESEEKTLLCEYKGITGRKEEREKSKEPGREEKKMQ